MGLLSDRIGRKRAMIMGFAIANCGIIAMILFHSEAAMLAMALLFGVGGQLYMISQAPFMMKASDDRTRDILFSFSYGMFPLSSALGNFIAGYLPDTFTNLLGLTTGFDYKRVGLQGGCALQRSFQFPGAPAAGIHPREKSGSGGGKSR